MRTELGGGRVIPLQDSGMRRGSIRQPSTTESPLKPGPPTFVYHHWDEEGDHMNPGRFTKPVKHIKTGYSI